jgi:hypothetical protein
VIDEPGQQGKDSAAEPPNPNETNRQRRERIRAGGASANEIAKRFGSILFGLKSTDAPYVPPSLRVPDLKIVPPDARTVRAVSATTEAIRELIQLQESLAERQALDTAAARKLNTWTFRLVALGLLVAIGSLIVAVVGL